VTPYGNRVYHKAQELWVLQGQDAQVSWVKAHSIEAGIKAEVSWANAYVTEASVC